MTTQRADPRARRLAIAVLVCVIVVATLAYAAADRWLTGVLALEPHVARRTLAEALRWMTLALSAGVFALGAYLLALGRRVVRAQRFPPPGFAVIKDVEVLEGRRAQTRGILIQGVSALLIVAALVLPLAAFRIAALLG